MRSFVAFVDARTGHILSLFIITIIGRDCITSRSDTAATLRGFFFVCGIERETAELSSSSSLPFPPSPLPVARPVADSHRRPFLSSPPPPMARKSRKDSSTPGPTVPWVPWKFTKCMNARDLSRDDDYLSHLFIEKMAGMSGAPLQVHRMDPTRRLPKTDMSSIYSIVQRVRRGSLDHL